MLKHISLRLKLAILFISIMVLLMVANYVWRSYVLEIQAEHEMFETTQVLAEEMDAIWSFMEGNQGQFVRNEDGTYNLYCVVAAKAVSHLFTTNNDRDFVIGYTNFETRKAADAPDAFEREALEALRADSGLQSYSALVTHADGSKVFRYVEPLYITESCLECHGDPAGELDVMGYVKEGMKEGDIAGAASIKMPADTYMANINASLVQETGIFVLFMFAGLAIIYFGVSRLVTTPVKRLEEAAQQIEGQDFNINLEGVGNRDEIEHLADYFTSMARQLEQLYTGLETQVETRTLQLEASNEILEQQRKELEEMYAKLERENRRQSDFLAIMSHEIRTPLTSILAFADIWAKTNTPRSPEEERIMMEMRLSSQVLLAMVNNILEMARAEAGRLELVPEPVDISDLVNMVRGSMDFLAEKKKVSLVFTIQRRIPVLIIDEEKTRRILENLISNAIKFVDEGGSVEVDIEYHEASGDLVLCVRDNGRGIADEDIPYIFERFSQGHDPRKHHHGGSGLGLAVVRELAELHGGSATLRETKLRHPDSREFSSGSCFVVTLKAQVGTLEMGE